MNESTQRSMGRASAMPQGSPAEVVGQPLPHDSATLHVSGRARYADDQPLPANTLHAAIGVSPIAHGRIRALDLDAVRQAAGVIGVITAEDIPGENQCGPIKPDDPILAPGLVQFV